MVLSQLVSNQESKRWRLTYFISHHKIEIKSNSNKDKKFLNSFLTNKWEREENGPNHSSGGRQAFLSLKVIK